MDKFLDRVAEAAQSVIVWLVIGLLSGIWWLVRRILTNQKEIEMLRQEMRFRDETRLRDREDIADIKAQLKEVHAMLITYIADSH